MLRNELADLYLDHTVASLTSMADSLAGFGTADMTGRHSESVAERCSFD